MSTGYRRSVGEMTGLSQNEKSVLSALADHANADTGLSWPGTRLIMRESGINHETTVNRVLAHLAQKGLISVQDQGSAGRGNTKKYKMLFPQSTSYVTEFVKVEPAKSEEKPEPSALAQSLSDVKAVLDDILKELQDLRLEVAAIRQNNTEGTQEGTQNNTEGTQEGTQKVHENNTEGTQEGTQKVHENNTEGTQKVHKNDLKVHGLRGNSAQPITIEPITIEPITTTTTTTAESSLSSSSESSSDVSVEEKTPEPITEPISSMADVSKLRKTDTGFDAMCAIYENEIEKITPLLAKEIYGLRSHPPGWWRDAIGVAAKAGRDKRKLSYIKGILSNWQAEGKNNGTNLRSGENSFSSKQQLAGSVSNDEYAHLSA